MVETVRNLTPPQQLLFWMLVMVVIMLLLLLTLGVAILVSERQKITLQANTLDAVRDLFRTMAQVNEYAVKKVTDAGKKAEEVKQEVKRAVKEVASLVAESPSALSIPSVDLDKSKETGRER